MNRMPTIVLAFALSGCGLAAESPSKPHPKMAGSPSRPAPETAASPEAIRKVVDGFGGFGCVQSVHFDRWGKEIFVLWYCPFSGRAACFLHGYYYDPKGKKRVRFLNDFVEGTPDPSASMLCGQQSVVIGDVNGKEVRKVDVASFPRRNWAEADGEAEPSTHSDGAKRTEP